MRGLYKLSAVANNLQAMRDWVCISEMVVSAGYPEIIEKNKPPENAGYRKIDNCIEKVKADLEKHGLKMYRDFEAETAQDPNYYKMRA